MVYFLYRNSPVFIQNLLCSLYGYLESRKRFNSDFFTLLLKFKESEWFNDSEILALKKEYLTRALISAKDSQLYPELNALENHDIESSPFDVLSSLSYLKKDSLIEKISNSNFKPAAGSYKIMTSGTTGKALILFKDKLSLSAQWAVWYRHRSRFDVQFKDLSVNFTGKPVVPIGQSKPPYWRFNSPQNQYLVSMQHINENTIFDLVNFLNNIKPKFYSGYPSIISELARIATQAGIKLDSDSRPNIVFTGAEKVLPYQKLSIESWTGVKLTDQYGLTEGSCNFSSCEFGNYHEDFEFCHIELADEEFFSDGSSRGRLIGTAFYNSATPLIRYDTGDIATLAPEGFRCPCGRNSRVILSVDGRIDDFILTPDGRQVMRLDYLFKDTDEVIEAQVIQEKENEIIILAVPSLSFNKDMFENKVKSHFIEYISDTMALVFSYTDSIPKGPNGKFKAVVNRIER
ncbi:hypothetical protein N5E91_04955 [Shewanella xiamenensis]|uniref:hypothetical protein n=1 Tax=Shewanella xiamenensis TaxID=332186 RepID=UPI00244B6FD9|nr:hypothetical protein [Shewanella xiamenensis]MDH1625467.1 hypothetical protein [Shewanella xiamenensis]